MSAKTGYDKFIENALKYGWMIPSGMIAMWHGTIATIPAGWYLCNGSNGTPDLRDKFIAGAKQDSGGVAKTNITGALLQSGGEISHAHNAGTLGAVSNGEHVHTFTTDGHYHQLGEAGEDCVGGGGWQRTTTTVQDTGTTASGGAHTHTISGAAAATTTVQPFYALAYIMKS